jgi:hypothetical protein
MLVSENAFSLSRARCLHRCFSSLGPVTRPYSKSWIVALQIWFLRRVREDARLFQARCQSKISSHAVHHFLCASPTSLIYPHDAAYRFWSQTVWSTGLFYCSRRSILRCTGATAPPFPAVTQAGHCRRSSWSLESGCYDIEPS